MTPARRTRAHLRRALTIHAAATLVVTLVVAGVSVAVSTLLADDASRRGASAVADTVAHAVAVPLGLVDLAAADTTARTLVLSELQAFIDADVIERAKIWRVEGTEAVVLFSDEPRNEGARWPTDPALSARLDAGEVVVFEVPDDPEHRYEFGAAGQLEAFIGFEDAAGRPMQLELYLPSSAPTIRASMLSVMLPVAVFGPLALAAATVPLSMRLGRRFAARDAERRELLHTALAASDRERDRLAARLHDGVIQNLAVIGLTLERLGAGRADDESAALTRLGDTVDADLADLRALLTEIAPPPFTASLPQALTDLADDLTTERTTIRVHADAAFTAPPAAAALLYRVARELLRNALEHAAPTAVEISVGSRTEHIELRVHDNGRGFDPHHTASDGHLGLALIRHALADRGGRLDIASGPSGTVTAVLLPVDAGPRERTIG